MSETPIEYPAGSGRIAYYSETERRIVRDLFHRADAGQIDRGAVARDVELIHEFKAVLGAELLE